MESEQVGKILQPLSYLHVAINCWETMLPQFTHPPG